MAGAGKTAKVISEAAEGAAKTASKATKTASKAAAAASDKKLIDVLKTFKDNLVKNSVMDNYVNRAVSWAIYGAGIGGVAAWAEGDSFWEGAKRGAFRGALAGAAYTAYKAGRGVPDSRGIKSNLLTGDAYGYMTTGTKMPGVSDQVTAIIRNEINSKLAVDALGLYGTPASRVGPLLRRP
mgnify:CR=1 FL=1